jgi:DNA-binding transcriptional ArsR family regulator
MVHHQTRELDAVFGALAHATRRQTLDRLARGPCSISDLAAPHRMSLGAFAKHVRALEAAGLIACIKQGRTVTCALSKRPFHTAMDWMASRERLWNTRMQALHHFLSEPDETQSAPRASRPTGANPWGAKKRPI